VNLFFNCDKSLPIFQIFVAADLKLICCVFMFIVAWFICGITSMPFLKVLEGETPSTPLHILIFLVLGWHFLFLDYYKSHK